MMKVYSIFFINYFHYFRKYNVSVRNLWDRVEGKPKEDLYDVILEYYLLFYIYDLFSF